jgi:hypothetical protein
MNHEQSTEFIISMICFELDTEMQYLKLLALGKYIFLSITILQLHDI